MSDAQAELANLKAELEAEQIRQQLEEARYAQKSLRTLNNLVETSTPSTHPTIIDPYDGLFDDGDFMVGGGNGYYSSVDDRKDGKFLPIYETESDLRIIRARCTKVAFLDAVGIGALESLADYTIGKGYQYTVTEKEENSVPSEMLEEMEELIRHILDVNDWTNCLDREYHHRCRVDGELLSVLRWDGADVRWHEEEPDYIKEPLNPPNGPAGSMDRPTSWTFGVHTVSKRPSEILGFHVVRDAEGKDWEYIPAERAVFYKSVPYRNAKRGVSEYWPIYKWLEDNSKLIRNMGQGAALQAAIAWIRELEPGAKASSASSRVVTEANYSRSVRGESGTQTRYGRHFPAGSIITVTGGKYHPGPMGAERNAGFIEVSQHLMRRIGVRWSLPEYLVSGDGSNGNFSTTSIQADSFVRARLSDQARFGKRDVEQLWKSLRMYYMRGKLNDRGLTWQEIRRMVDIKFVAEDPNMKDPLAKREALKIETEAGWTSDETAARELNRDYEEEVRKGAERRENPAMAMAQETGQEGGKESKPPVMDESFREQLNQMYFAWGEKYT